MSAAEKLTAKEYLTRLKSMDKLLNAKAKCLLEHQQMLSALGGSSSNVKVQTSNVSNRTQDMAVKLAILEQEAVTQCFELVQFRTKVMKMIADMDFNSQIIVYDYYIQNKTFEKVAEDMNMTVVWVQNLHRKMLAEFQKVLDSQGIA